MSGLARPPSPLSSRAKWPRTVPKSVVSHQRRRRRRHRHFSPLAFRLLARSLGRLFLPARPALARLASSTRARPPAPPPLPHFRPAQARPRPATDPSTHSLTRSLTDCTERPAAQVHASAYPPTLAMSELDEPQSISITVCGDGGTGEFPFQSQSRPPTPQLKCGEYVGLAS